MQQHWTSPRGFSRRLSSQDSAVAPTTDDDDFNIEFTAIMPTADSGGGKDAGSDINVAAVMPTTNIDSDSGGKDASTVIEYARKTHLHLLTHLHGRWGANLSSIDTAGVL